LMEDVDFSEKKIRSVKIGKFAIVLSEGKLTFSNDKNHFEFGLRDLKNLTLTRKEELSFDIGEKTYFVNFKDPMLFFDAINQLNGGIE